LTNKVQFRKTFSLSKLILLFWYSTYRSVRTHETPRRPKNKNALVTPCV